MKITILFDGKEGGVEIDEKLMDVFVNSRNIADENHHKSIYIARDLTPIIESMLDIDKQPKLRRKAPWPDYEGNPIFAGDTIRHQNGERGEVVFQNMCEYPSDQWRVCYDDRCLARLCLQIGDKGRAVVVVS